MSDFLPVSIVMPAYNAAATIGEAIESVLAQTMPHWELIVVDDGSTDETAAIVQGYVQQDGRIHLLQQANAGGSAARNSGIAQARFGWLLFLDADDWLLPAHLEKMTAALKQNASLDAVHCGWHRVAPDGSRGEARFAPDQPDLFPVFAEQCAFQTNACLVHVSLVTAVSGFDESLQTCQDWDFWQRIARSGARFGAVAEVLALYRTRPGSVSLNGVQQLRDSLRVISQAYTPNANFAALPYADGLPPAQAAAARIRFACWSFGLILGSGEDARPYLSLLADDTCPGLDPAYVAGCLFEAAVLPRGLGTSGWDILWPEIGTWVEAFLLALEKQVRAPDLVQPALRHLERLILENSPRERPLAVGGTWAAAIDLEQPFSPMTPPLETAVCRCELWLEGDSFGVVDLAVDAAVVTGEQVAQAIAQEFAWPILERYFALHLFPQLQLAEGEDGIFVWRDVVLLATLPTGEPGAFWVHVWNEIGWLLFLQEAWGCPAWPKEYFYDETLLEPGETAVLTVDSAVSLALTDPFPDLLVHSDEIMVTLTVAKEAVVQVALTAPSGRISAQRLRAALTRAAGFDLCRAVVQHALLERPLAQPDSLRQRLGEFREIIR